MPVYKDPEIQRPRHAAFYLGRHCLLGLKPSSELELQYFLMAIINCDPLTLCILETLKRVLW